MKDKELEKDKTKDRELKGKIRILAVLAVLLLYIFGTAISIRGNLLEIREIGERYTVVLERNLKSKYTVSLITFVIVYISIYINNKIIKNGLKKFFDDDKKELPKLPNKSIAFIVAIVISIFTSTTLTESFMMFISNAWFGGNTDPVFNLDIAHYMFTLPFVLKVLKYLIVYVVGLIIYTAVYYVIVLNYFLDGIDIQTLKKNTFINQVIAFIAIIAVLFAIMTFINSQNILTENMINIKDAENTSLVGAGVTDVTIKLWGYRILGVVIIVSITLALIQFKKINLRKFAAYLCLIPAYLVGLFVVMTVFQMVYVNSNELEKEKEYIAYNMRATQNAYGINISETEISEYDTITDEEVINYSEVFENVNLISEDVTLKTLTEKLSNSGYYTFQNTSVQNYRINGKNELVYVTAREIVADNTRSSNSRTYEYTHGYGAVITSASRIDKSGYVEYIQNSFQNEDDKINISEPRIYYGLKTNNTVITNTKKFDENDYPITTIDFATNSYDGNGGTNLKFFDRLILGITQGNLKIAFSNQITENSKILINRNIIERAKTILPYLKYDENPYLVITDSGKLVWVIDAYTTSDKYPYSQISIVENEDGSKERINYIRNSVKVLVDAYNGTTQFYITDRTDPIAMAYANLYPQLFMEAEKTIPEDIQKQFTYPKYLYKIQAKMIEMYHNTNIEVLYRADDLWKIATQSTANVSTLKGTEIEPYYTTLKPVDSEKTVLGLVLPYTKINKQSLNAYLVGTYENSSLKLSLYKFSQDSNVPRSNST